MQQQVIKFLSAIVLAGKDGSWGRDIERGLSYGTLATFVLRYKSKMGLYSARDCNRVLIGRSHSHSRCGASRQLAHGHIV